MTDGEVKIITAAAERTHYLTNQDKLSPKYIVTKTHCCLESFILSYIFFSMSLDDDTPPPPLPLSHFLRESVIICLPFVIYITLLYLHFAFNRFVAHP